MWNPRKSSWMGEGGARGLETLQSGFQLILIMFILELVVFPGWSLWTTRWFSVSFQRTFSRVESGRAGEVCSTDSSSTVLIANLDPTSRSRNLTCTPAQSLYFWENNICKFANFTSQTTQSFKKSPSPSARLDVNLSCNLALLGVRMVSQLTFF